MCCRSKNRAIYDNPKNSSCFTTFHPYCLRFSCYTLGKKKNLPPTQRCVGGIFYACLKLEGIGLRGRICPLIAPFQLFSFCKEQPEQCRASHHAGRHDEEGGPVADGIHQAAKHDIEEDIRQRSHTQHQTRCRGSCVTRPVSRDQHDKGRIQDGEQLTARSHRPGAPSRTPAVYRTAALVAKSRRQR